MKERDLVREVFPKLNWQPAQSRFKVMCVLAGVATIGEVGIHPTYNYSENLKDAWPDDYHDLHHALETVDELRYLGLAVDYRNDENNVGEIAFALKEKDLLEYTKMYENKTYDNKQFGNFFGIPETAVKAWPNRRLRREQTPEYISKDPLSKLLYFVLSQKNYEVEWKNFTNMANQVLNSNVKLAKDLNLGSYLKG